MLSVREAHIEKEKCTRESHPASERRYMQRTNQTFRCLFRCTNKPWNLRFFFPVLFFRAYRVYRKPMRVASVHKQPGCSENGVRRISITGLPYVRLRKGLVKTKKRERKKKKGLVGHEDHLITPKRPGCRSSSLLFLGDSDRRIKKKKVATYHGSQWEARQGARFSKLARTNNEQRGNLNRKPTRKVEEHRSSIRGLHRSHV